MYNWYVLWFHVVYTYSLVFRVLYLFIYLNIFTWKDCSGILRLWGECLFSQKFISIEYVYAPKGQLSVRNNFFYFSLQESGSLSLISTWKFWGILMLSLQAVSSSMTGDFLWYFLNWLNLTALVSWFHLWISFSHVFIFNLHSILSIPFCISDLQWWSKLMDLDPCLCVATLLYSIHLEPNCNVTLFFS